LSRRSTKRTFEKYFGKFFCNILGFIFNNNLEDIDKIHKNESLERKNPQSVFQRFVFVHFAFNIFSRLLLKNFPR